MNSIFTPESPDTTTPISIHTAHGSVHGLITLPPDASGLIVLAHAGATPDAHDEALAIALRQAGMATLLIDLLTSQEEHFADVHNNVPLLAKRLLDCLSLIKRQMDNEELPKLPLGLCAADSTSPVVIRVAALRDHDIAAIACRGGLIDLAGMLYLRSLESPLLVVVSDQDETLLAISQRALKEVVCANRLEVIPASNSNFNSKIAMETITSTISSWFVKYCRAFQSKQGGS